MFYTFFFYADSSLLCGIKIFKNFSKVWKRFNLFIPGRDGMKTLSFSNVLTSCCKMADCANLILTIVPSLKFG